MFNLRRKRRRCKKYNILDSSKPLEQNKIIPLLDYGLFKKNNKESHHRIVAIAALLLSCVAVLIYFL